MIIRKDKQALQAALHLIGSKIMGYPIGVPWKAHFMLENNYIVVSKDGLIAKFILNGRSHLIIEILRNYRTTLIVMLPYDTAVKYS